MRTSSVELTSSLAQLPSLPISLEQSSSRSSPIVIIAVLLPVALALVVPFALVVEHVAADPGTRAVIADRPAAAIQLILAAAVLVSLFWWPLARSARSLAYGRSIAIDKRGVTVTEHGLFGGRTWSEPLAGYLGLAHHVRASLSGLRHELLLVHPDAARTVLVAVANRIPQEEVDRLASVIGVAEITSRDAYSLSQLRGVLGPAGPQPRLGVART